MRFGLSVPNFAEPSRLVELARRAEAAGWDGFFLWDHIDGGFGAEPPPLSDPWTVLGAVAVQTSRVRIGTLVTPVPRRRPWVLARQVVTVDHLSGGRVVLGVGLGTPPEAEYLAFGEDPSPRRHGEMLDEGLEIITRLWSGQATTYTGQHYRLDEVRFLPTPLQAPRVPIWVAATLPAHAGLRRAARWDGVVPLYNDGEFRFLQPDELARAMIELSRHQPSNSFEVVVSVAEADADLRRAYEQAGATWLIEGPAPGPDWYDDALDMSGRRPPLR